MLHVHYSLVLFGKGTENGTKKPSAKPGNRVPRVKVLNYLKKVALFFRFERDILANLADGEFWLQLSSFK